MAATFDGINLLITLEAPTVGILNQTAEQVYDDSKVWFLGGENSNFPFPFTTSGGEQITDIELAGQYYFLRNDLGWRIRSSDEDQQVNWTGNLIPTDLTLPIFVAQATRTVSHLGLQPLTTIITTGSGVTQQDKDDIEDQIFARLIEAGFSFEELVRILASHAAGDVDEPVDGTYEIRDLADTKPRISGTQTANGGRDVTAVDGT